MTRRRRAVTAGLVLGAAVAGCNGAPELRRSRAWNFEDDAPDRPAAGWIVPRVGGGSAPVPAGWWTVDRDPRAPSPAQLLRQRSTHFAGDHANLAVADTPPIRDFRLLVQVRAYPGARAARVASEYATQGLDVPADVPTAGEHHGGGPFFRYADPANHYALRWDPAESVVRLEVVRHGRRAVLATGRVDTPADDTTWHLIEVACRGPRIVAAFDGVQVIEHEDWAHTTGRVGVWTQGDASAGFDDLLVEPLGPPPARK